MGDLRLKPGVKVEYDKENFSYKFVGVDIKKMKKVTSRAFSCLLGQNQWESVGKTILERFGATKKDEIDPYYMVRGDMAELLVLDFLKEQYQKQHINIDLKTWDKEAVSYDNFARNDKFGGLLDIAIASPKEHRAVIEVKSKSIKDYEKIKKSKGNIDEVLQGKFLTKLSSETKCLMIYVFFEQGQEDYIKEFINSEKAIGLPFDSRMLAKQIIKSMDWSFKVCKKLVFKYDISEEQKTLETDMKVAYNNLVHFKKECKIAETYFSDKEIAYLNRLAEENGFEVKNEEKALF